LLWVLGGWIAFPIGIVALPIAAGFGIVMVIVYGATMVGGALAQAGEEV
jgi:hypothetical protein